MRVSLIPVLALGLIAASDLPPPSSLPLANPAYSAPATPWQDLSEAVRITITKCADRVRPAQSRGVTIEPDRPLLERKPANPEDEAYLIWAVDRRENGCGVMVMMGNLNDIRQVPKKEQRSSKFLSIDGDQ